jgi:DNA-directed RNA polymerase
MASASTSSDGLRRCIVRTRPFYSNQQKRSSSTVLSPWSAAVIGDDFDVDEFDGDAFDDDDYEMDQIERITSDSLAQLLPRYYETVYNTHDSLKLELGEKNAWDQSWEMLQRREEYQDNAQPVKQKGPEMYSELSMMEKLVNFDPQNPPLSNDLEEVQLWLECEAQQEGVVRYQRAINAARSRKDYASLSSVQRQVLKWFQPLSDGIETLQKSYLLKEGESKKSIKRFGPYLCTLPPAKLAVIVAHEAIIFSLQHSSVEGVPFVYMARRLGRVVEEEVVIQRLLHKRFLDSQQNAPAVDSETLESVAKHLADAAVSVKESKTADVETASAVSVKESKTESTAETAHMWAYSKCHLDDYLEEVSKHEPSAKRARVVRYAIKKARTVLGTENWTETQQIHLGAALFQVLLATAAVNCGGKDEMGFIYEKHWTTNSKLQSFVRLHQQLEKAFISSKLQSFAATTTRHKPMILPPKPWTRPDNGGYKWLKVDLMRYHGCNIQKVSSFVACFTTHTRHLNLTNDVVVWFA